MAEQQAPEVGAVLDGYRFKGGDPKQESSWEQVAPIDVSAQYGAGARQLPNGRIERVGPRGGVTKIADAAGGGSESSPLVGADARARFMINLGPLQESQRILEEMDAAGYNPSNFQNTAASALEAIPFDGGYAARAAGGDDYNAYTQATKTFEAAILPIMSGAAVTPTEAQRLIRAALPQPGDSPEVLRQKAVQRRQMINAVAQGIGNEAPYGADKPLPGSMVGPADETGLPTYPQIEAQYGSTGGGMDLDAPPPPGDPNVPGSGPDNPIDLGSLGPDELMRLQPGQYVRRADGTTYALPSSPFRGARQEGDESEGSAVVRPQNPGTDTYIPGVGSMAAASGFLEQIPLGDEAVAGIAGLIDPERGYTDYRQAQRQRAAYDRENNSVQRNLGGVAGGLTVAATPLGAPVRATRGATVAGRVLNRAAGGAVGGAAYGFGQGEGNALERSQNALAGGAIGFGAGAVAQPVVNALTRTVVEPVVRGAQATARGLGRGVANALGESAPAWLNERTAARPLESAARRFADRMGTERVNALAPAAAERRGLGIQPTLIDTLDDASVGRVRALATRDTPARDQAVRFAEGRRANLPSRAARIAREEISDDTRPALDILDAQRQTRRTNAAGIQDFGADPVPLSQDAIEALRSDLVQPALRQAAQRAQAALNPADREAANRLNQIAATVLDNPSAARLTVREAQDISKALNDAADSAYRSGSPEGPVFKDLANAIRGSARDSSEGYSAWLRQYGDDSDLIEAATTGRNFVSVSSDPVSARSTEAFVRNAEQAPAPAREIMRATAREASEVAASNPTGARTVLDRFANDTDMSRRVNALGADAGRVQARSQAELDALTRAQRASPRVGSETSTNAQDAGNAAGLALDTATLNIRGLAGRAMRAIQSRGFSNQEAEAMVSAAVDPARTDELIGMLAQRMNRREARNLARAVRYQVTTGLQSGQQN